MVALMSTQLSGRRRIVAILCGGFLGTISRYLLSIAIQHWLGNNWPYDILLINITGACFLAFVTTLADATLLIGPTRRLFINVGFLGAYTTFSSLALGDVLLFNKGQWLLAILYLLTSMLGGILAVLLGDGLGRQYIKFVRHVPTRKHVQAPLSTTFYKMTKEEHLDLQDDILSK
jgi:fluoride exporter